MIGRAVLGVGLAFVAFGILLVMLPSAEAGSISVPGTAIREGQSIALTIVPDTDEMVRAGDRVVVTDPRTCAYSTPATPGTAPFSVTYPGTFSALASNGASCPTQAHTALATAGEEQYTVAFVAEPLPSQDPYMSAEPEGFRVLLTEHEAYARTSQVGVAGVGFTPGAPANVQVDAPERPNFLSLPATADSTGRITSSFVLPKGLDAPSDVGTWTVRIVPTGSGANKVTDRQTFSVMPTEIGFDWHAASVPASVMRAGMISVYGTAVYNGSAGNAAPVHLTNGDVAGGVLDLAVERNGVQVQTATASYDPVTRTWRASFQVNKDAPAGSGYTVRIRPDGEDRYGNSVEAARSPSFAVTQATITPTFTILRPAIERANPEKGLSATVRLTYPSGVPVAVEDMRNPNNPDGVLQAALYEHGAQVPGSLFLGVFVGNGVWEFKDQILPRDTPVGEVTFRLLPAEANPSAVPPNPVRTDFASQPMTVSATQPRLQVTMLKGAEPVTGILRGQELTVRVRPLYANGGTLEHSDVAGGGRALLRVVPGNNSLAFVREFTYDPANAWWQTTYTPKPTDPVGTWTFNVLFTDRWDNDNMTLRTLRVGLQVNTQLSATSLARTGELTLTSTMSLPGSAEAVLGTMNVTVTDPLGARLGPVQTMQPVTGGKYTAKVAFPANAVLGTYVVTVQGAGSADSGKDVQPVQLGSSDLQVKALNLTASSVQRLGTVGAQVRLSYPNGVLLDPSKATPQLAFRPASGPSIPVPLAYNATAKAWVGSHVPALDATLGTGRFVLSAKDVANNSLSEFLSSPVRVDPAEIKVVSLATLRTQYLRGETVTVRAVLAYSDGGAPVGTDVAVDLRAGNVSFATLQLRPTAAKTWEGSLALPLDAPLGTPAQPWRAVLAKDSVRDAHGNRGPAGQDASTPFNVQPALLGITILEQTQLPGSGVVRIAFAVTAPDGTRVNVPIGGLRALLVRDGQIGDADVVLVPKDDHYVATLPANQVLAGQYTVRLEGSDATGNQVTGLESEPFSIQAHAKEKTPMPGIALAVAALALALARRPGGRRD